MSEVRLIDVNAAISVFADMGQDIDTHDVIDLLKEQPTVDAAPVVRAYWRKYSYDEAICSHCGYDRSTEFECTSEAEERWGELPKYCENCGAIMNSKRRKLK